MNIDKVVPVSEPLLAFLEDWLWWAKSPATFPSGNVYSKRLGLCAALMKWCGFSPFDRKYLYLSEELESSFSACGLDKSYPFGEQNFNLRIRGYDQHLDPARLAWVRKVIADNQGGK